MFPKVRCKLMILPFSDYPIAMFRPLAGWQPVEDEFFCWTLASLLHSKFVLHGESMVPWRNVSVALLRLFSIDGIVRHHRTLSCLAIDLLIVGTNHLYFIIVISASESSLLIGVTLFAEAFVIISVLSVDVMMMRSVVMTIVDRHYPLTGTTHYARGRTKFK